MVWEIGEKTAPVEDPEAIAKKEKEATELALILEGAPRTAEEKSVRSFIRSNQRHMYADAACGTAAYIFSALQHVQGQSNALTLLSMWTAGTTFLVSIATRQYAIEQVMGPVEAREAKKEDSKPFLTALPISDAMAVVREQRSSSFQLETIASWVWMLAAFQQFKVHKTLKWSGYCSWTGLCCGLYFTLRHVYNVMIE